MPRGEDRELIVAPADHGGCGNDADATAAAPSAAAAASASAAAAAASAAAAAAAAAAVGPPLPPGSSTRNDELPSVGAIFGQQGDRRSSSETLCCSLFPSSHHVVHDDGALRERLPAVRQQDIPDVLKRMSEMQIFVGSASGTGGDVNGTLSKGVPSLPREPDNSAVVFDVDALRAAFAAAKQAFPPHWNHCVAVKSCPLSVVVQEAVRAGLGIEAASFVELYMGLALGCPAELAAFDSPAKTDRELEMALARGVLINANSLVELDRIDAIIKRQGCSTSARVGIRLNPLVGAGSIAELSVSTSTSKFAVPMTPANVLAVVDAFRKWPWLVALHTHVGSQGYSIEQLAEGIAVLCEIADVIDGKLGKGRVTLLDIGGGLPANYDSDEVSPTFYEYAAALLKAAPSLFDNTERIVVTEFGRAFVAKVAMTVSKVEYVRSSDHSGAEGGAAGKTTQQAEDPSNVIDSSGEAPESSLPVEDYQTLVTHIGADLFLRTSYCPGRYSHRLSMYSRNGAALSGSAIRTDVAGPLCFQGDYVARGASLPRASPGDLVVVHDTGANTLSLFSRHCSRRFPSVYGYARNADGTVCVRLVKEKESVQDVARFWGACV